MAITGLAGGRPAPSLQRAKSGLIPGFLLQEEVGGMDPHDHRMPFAVLDSTRGFIAGNALLLDVPVPTAEVRVLARPAELDRTPQAWIEECLLPDQRVSPSLASHFGCDGTSPDVLYFAILTRRTVEDELEVSRPVAFLDVEFAIAWARALTAWVQVLATRDGDGEPRYYNATPEHGDLPGPEGRPLPPWHS